MRRGMIVIFLISLIPGALALVPETAVATKAGEEILAQAFAYMDGEEDRFQPYSGSIAGHFWLRDGDDQLDYEMRHWSRFIKWTPDSTEILEEGEEVLFQREEEENEADEEEGEGKDDDEDLDLDFLEADRRESYRYRFEDVETRDGRELGRFELKPRRKKKDLWRGRFWMDSATGAVALVDIEPAKKRFGLKKMRIRMDFFEFEGMNLPRRMEMDIEAKLPFIVHVKIHSEMDFEEYALIEP